MNDKYLHLLIKDILTETGDPLSVKSIYNLILKNELWYKPSDKNIPSTNQVSARINNHPELFNLKNGLVYLINREKRLLRITWNEKRWELPSGHVWSKANQEKKNIAHENQYGFGGEEWLFNTRYEIEGFQYGFIRGLWEVTNIDFINIAYLYTINPQTKERLLIAKINNIELLDPDNLPLYVTNVFDRYKNEMISELQDVKADISRFKHYDFYPIIKFRMEDAEIFDKPHLINELKKGNKYNRFKPYTVKDDLQQLIDKQLIVQPFVFSPGKRKNDNSSYTKTSSGKSTFIKGVHAQIVNDLENYLYPEFSINNKNISIEKTIFGENIADLVTQNKDKSYSIFEVKTSYNTRFNIRDAIGQLLDYALWHDNLMIKELVIVAPGIILNEHIAYLRRLNSNLILSLKFLKYDTSIKEKFKEIIL